MVIALKKIDILNQCVESKWYIEPKLWSNRYIEPKVWSNRYIEPIRWSKRYIEQIYVIYLYIYIDIFISILLHMRCEWKVV